MVKERGYKNIRTDPEQVEESFIVRKNANTTIGWSCYVKTSPWRKVIG